ncbi:GNAT family N-acetyltransferase [Sphingomonas sp. TX0543]|uniref:GNAT family N-acetyltransferase n=1 Tax=unclassified Sphingomonas TaxID=196159 RepID=UPI00201652E2|nr:GNAT family N-acetyltransferase [Sphingomonas sp. 3P27F8]
MSASALRLQIGARTIAEVPRRLRRVALSLDQALGAELPELPPLDSAEHGYLLTSLPDALSPSWPGIAFVRQRYIRYFVDLRAGEAAWLAGLSGNARATMKRKEKKLAAANGGTLDVRRYRTPAELAECHPLARAVSETTYQERLLGSGLPADPAHGQALAAEDGVRAWLLFLRDVPIAYLWCGADGNTLRYDHVGHDPVHGALSPGSVLMAVALADLFGDRFRRFDFTEGEGQHKRAFASGGIRCRDLLLLRPTLANRAVVAAVSGFDTTMRLAARAARTPALARIARRLRRA